MPPRKDNTQDDELLDWVELKKTVDTEYPVIETYTEKAKRRTKENPLVPIGAFATAGILGYGLWCFRTGQTKRAQTMMRARVTAQGLTIGILLAGILYSSLRKPH